MVVKMAPCGREGQHRGETSQGAPLRRAPPHVIQMANVNLMLQLTKPYTRISITFATN